jgi:hypothetical protein
MVEELPKLGSLGLGPGDGLGEDALAPRRLQRVKLKAVILSVRRNPSQPQLHRLSFAKPVEGRLS